MKKFLSALVIGITGMGTILARTAAGTGTFSFVHGHYYCAASRVINQYDDTGNVVASYTLPSPLGESVNGLAFGADGLLYACVSRGSAGFAVLALQSDGQVVASYVGGLYIAGGSFYGKIALDRQYLYVCGQSVLMRFRLGDSSSGTIVYEGGGDIVDVMPLPSGHLFVALQSNVDEITSDGEFVRRIQLTQGQFFNDIRGIEYNPATNILFVTHLGYSGFSFRIMRVDATTSTLLNSTILGYPDDMFLDLAGNLLVGSEATNPTFFTQNLGQLSSLNGGLQSFVTQYAPGMLANISTRLPVETGDNALIGGFIVTGTQPKKVIIRAIGPSLPVAGALADPVLELRDSLGSLIRANDNWRSDQENEILETGIPPANDFESAIVMTLPANNSAFTAIVRGANEGTGIGLVEVYDLDRTADSTLGNISTRGLVQTGDNALIAGTILLGRPSRRVIVRALGPSLPVPDKLADPALELRDGNGGIIRSNDNWRSDQEDEIIATGIPPANDLESAIVQTLPAYGATCTAIVRGVNDTTGVAVVEVYQLD